MLPEVVKWGNSLALRIPSALARTLIVTAGRSVELKAENGRLVVTPVDDKPVYGLDELLAGMDPHPAQGEADPGGPVGGESF